MLLLLIAIVVVAVAQDIPLDENNRVARNLYLVRSSAPQQWLDLRPAGRQVLIVENNSYFASEHVIAACIWKGFPVEYLNVSINTATVEDDMEEFQQHLCDHMEMGFISYFEGETLSISYIESNDNKPVQVEKLNAGERNTAWIHTIPGHKFLVKGKKFQRYYTAETPSIFIVGEPPDYTKLNATISPANKLMRVRQELSRVRQIKRVFTDVGFKKAMVPRNAWAEISTYWYNNKHNRAREEWINTGFFVNWHEVNEDLVVPPFVLKARWQQLFLPVMEEWSNTKLEPTDIFGIRTYYNGAWLSNHVDRETTHAVSGIINVEQINVSEPWEVHIWDIHGNRQRVEMEPGTMLFYESARCVHGRPVPLVGSEYTNIFVHYRPVNNPRWFQDATVGKLGPDITSKFDPKQADGHEISWVGMEAKEKLERQEL